jgi:isocitrate dehydrogenase (NAD+)
VEHTVTLIVGDGIGPEVCACAERVVAASGATIKWERAEAGAAVADKTGTPLPQEVLDSVKRNRVALKGPIGTPIARGFKSVNVTLRKELDLYACLRPVRTIPGVPARYDDVDLIVVRENTEGLYAGLEHMVVPGVAESLKIITEKASMRIADFAFRMARHQNRKKVTAVHKANIMKLSDGLFMSSCESISKKYPDIAYDTIIVDNCAMQLVRNPKQFDVLVMDNLYGDILSDLCAGLVGGLGVVPGANIGDRYAVFEAVHGSAPDIAGKGVANPTALILTSSMMLRHLGETASADRIERAVHELLRKGEVRTRDLGGTASSSEFTDAILRQMK